MGATASSEVKAAEVSIRKLRAELRSLQALAGRKEELLDQARDELSQAKSKLKQHDKQAIDARAYTRLEEALRTTRSEAEAERAKYREAHEELARARDQLQQATGELKFRALSTGRGGGELGDAARSAAYLVTETNQALSQSTDHAVYGALLSDFGYKKLYRADPCQLWTSTLLWERQRAFRDDRAAMIAKAKAASLVGGWPGSIAVVERGQNGGIVVDGQHRLGAAWLLSQQQKIMPKSLSEIVVEVYPEAEDARVFELFAEINKCEPVALVDMPSDVVEGGATRDDREAIDAAAIRLKSRYADMFKPSRACRPPHVNVDVLRDEIHKSGILRHLEQQKQSLDDWIEMRNRDLAALPYRKWHDDPSLRCRAFTKAAIDNALAKATKFNFFLGLTWAWLQHE